MGICSSCLGRRRKDSFDEDDVTRLLFDDPNNLQYGSFADHNLNSQADPLESQHESESLQRVVARTSNTLVDVFEIAPQESHRTQAMIVPQRDARVARYQNILSEMPVDDGTRAVDSNPKTTEWLWSDEHPPDPPRYNIAHKEALTVPLVGTFADVDDAAPAAVAGGYD
ncbi:late endosomal/lysosomal adaptor and MAPK and MTOR activator-domain-containing protein [Xylaria sp. CBS 124048]|nr:late endosomal/lysosomal adaptor and MAPK and MTOR activator-domain-containing protein [Xylaria sp. CBS 124048]